MYSTLEENPMPTFLEHRTLSTLGVKDEARDNDL